MTDEMQTTPAKEKEAMLSFRLPDKWTLLHWDTFSLGQSEYQEWYIKQHEQVPSVAQRRYAGALKLIANGLISVNGTPEYVAILKLPMQQQSGTDLRLIGEVLRAICTPMEACFDVPLD